MLKLVTTGTYKPESTIAKFIEKNNGNGGMHHLAFAVEDGVANALAEAETTASVSLTKLRVKV